MANKMYERGKRLRPEIIQEMKERYLSGEKLVVIKSDMGVSERCMSKYVYRFGCPLRRPDIRLRLRLKRLQRFNATRDDPRSKNKESNQQALE